MIGVCTGVYSVCFASFWGCDRVQNNSWNGGVTGDGVGAGAVEGLGVGDVRGDVDGKHAAYTPCAHVCATESVWQAR